MAQSTTGGTSSRRHIRDHDTASIASSKYADTEWEAKEALRQRELEEARARAAQMEKTMRWWSDCTANWREKWSKVRNERNKAREEAKQLRMKLDGATKDSTLCKREKNDLEIQNEQLKKEIEKIHVLLLKHAGQFDGRIFEALGGELHNNEASENEPNDVRSLENGTECDDGLSLLDFGKGDACEEYVLRGAVPKQNPESGEYMHASKTDDSDRDDKTEKLNRIKDDADDDYLVQKISMLQLRLDESNKTIHSEREEKNQLHRNLEKISTELQEMKEKYEELKAARQEAVRELLILQDRYKDEVRLIRADLQDEASSREGMDRRLVDLRAELERLQAENAAEWGKRERLETEKLSLERDNKKLRSELRDMQERLDRKGRPISTTDVELRQMQQELSDKNKAFKFQEIAELKHSHSKLKKMMQDKITELAHATRRAEQYETEVKKLRARVEELKKDLAVAEDEVDAATNNIRKLQRSNDELQEQVENFQVQLQHLHTRLRNCGSSSLLSHRSQTLLAEDISDEELNEY